MPRPLWTGALSFGLVNIPVSVHTAVRDSRPRFRMLHAKDKSPIHFERVCQKEGRPVAWDDIVKGYEYEKGRFVVLTKEDLAAAALEKTRRIDVVDFVEAQAIDDRFFDKPYYLAPGKGGDAAFVLLLEAIRRTGRIGVAKFILRDVQHLAAVEAIGDTLVLSMLRFADELVDADAFTFRSRKMADRKTLDTAVALIENLASEWKPEKYTDDYRANLQKLVRAKLKGKQARLVSDDEPRDRKVVDLMERLRASLAASGRARPSGHRRTAAPKRRGSRRRAA